jgi:CheY-like chemotaxis protein
MTTALVVDDSKVDQRFVSSVVKRSGVDIQLADDGESALSFFRHNPVDLVVTDMQMPGLDGLELVKAIRKTDLLVPIVLVTAHGSEELAMKALRAGASSYVPKRQISRDLPGTIEQVLSLACSAKDHEKALACLVGTQCSLTVPNDYDVVGAVIHYLRSEVARMNLCDHVQLNHLALALDEAFSNAIDHGNLEVPSALRDPDPQLYLRTVQERQSQPPYADRKVHINANFSRERAAITVRDEGSGFDYCSIEDFTAPESLTKSSGRGLLLIHMFTDEVRHNDSGNEITLIKYRANSLS